MVVPSVHVLLSSAMVFLDSGCMVLFHHSYVVLHQWEDGFISSATSWQGSQKLSGLLSERKSNDLLNSRDSAIFNYLSSLAIQYF